jgi:endonuclease/exonuclease/phosphatase family metal-dependent hydrolase
MPNPIRISKIILYGLVFLLFFQLVSDFVETIYAFGLLGTNIPPEIVSVLLFFSPLVLLFFRRGLSRQAGWMLAILAAVLRAVEGVASTNIKMLASGLGTGCLLVLLPVWLAQASDEEEDIPSEMGCGLAIGLSMSVLFRSLGAGRDISLLHPWVSWVEMVCLDLLVVWVYRQQRQGESSKKTQPAPEAGRAPFGIAAALCTGLLGVLAVLYFGFTSPTVLARWSGVDYRLVVGLLALVVGLFGCALAFGWLARFSRQAIWAWNGLFLLAGSLAILSNQVQFPANSSAYPIDQPALSMAQQAPLLIMILLSPVCLLDGLLLVREIKTRRPSPRTLAGGFALGALFFLIIVLAQVFTTVYDYIPVVGPLFRDRFWLVFLLAGLGIALPAIATRPAWEKAPSPVLRNFFIPMVCLPLLTAFGWVQISQPAPAAPANQAVLRVITYNIQQGYSAAGDRNYAGQLALLHSLDPDIVGLEESDVARFSGGNADVVRTISEGLGMNVYYGPRTVTGTFGIALLSRYPLENPHTFFMYSSGEQTAAIQAQITVNGKRYTILVTHLGNGGPIIQQQQVLSRLAGQANVIAMGDFNFEPATEQYNLTLQTLQDAWVQVGSPLPATLDPRKLIDHFFVSPGTPVSLVRYVDAPVSDHPLLMMEIKP